MYKSRELFSNSPLCTTNNLCQISKLQLITYPINSQNQKIPTTVANYINFPRFYLSACFLGFLQKSQEENENIISKEVDVNSEFFQSLLKEQGYLQNNVKHLTALEKSFNEELNHLRSLIRHSKEEQTSNAYGDYREIQTLVEYGLNSLHENIFSIEGM